MDNHDTIMANGVSPANVTLVQTPVKQGVFQQTEEMPYIADFNKVTPRPTPKGSRTPRVRYQEADTRMAEDENDNDDDDAFVGCRDFDDLSSDLQRQLSFDDAERKLGQVMETRTHVRLDKISQSNTKRYRSDDILS